MPLHTINGRKIRTTNVPPIPHTDLTWCAVEDDKYEAPSSPIGWGATEQEAIAALLEEIEARKE